MLIVCQYYYRIITAKENYLFGSETIYELTQFWGLTIHHTRLQEFEENLDGGV